MEQPLETITRLLKAIREKHGSPCTFTVRQYSDEISYQTYIADDVWPAHVTHDTPEAALVRLEAFLNINDLSEHNNSVALAKIQNLQSQKDHIEDQIADLDRHLTANGV